MSRVEASRTGKGRAAERVAVTWGRLGKAEAESRNPSQGSAGPADVRRERGAVDSDDVCVF